MGTQHVRDGMLQVRQQKTGAPLQLPIFPELYEAIDAMPSKGKHLNFLVTETRKPFSPAGSQTGFATFATKRVCEGSARTVCARRA
jgi:hypothetical protein